MTRPYRHALFICAAILVAGEARAQTPSAGDELDFPAGGNGGSQVGWGSEFNRTDPQSMRELRAAEQKVQRAAFFKRQRELTEELYYRLGTSPMRPSWPANPYMQSHYPPRRTVYVPIIVAQPVVDPAAW
jgi:hypothetical protein